MNRGLSAALGGIVGFVLTASIASGCICLGDAPPVPTGTLQLDVSEYGGYYNEGVPEDYTVVVSEDRTRLIESYTVEGRRHEVGYDVVRTASYQSGGYLAQLPPEE